MSIVFQVEDGLVTDDVLHVAGAVFRCKPPGGKVFTSERLPLLFLGITGTLVTSWDIQEALREKEPRKVAEKVKTVIGNENQCILFDPVGSVYEIRKSYILERSRTDHVGRIVVGDSEFALCMKLFTPTDAEIPSLMQRFLSRIWYPPCKFYKVSERDGKPHIQLFYNHGIFEDFDLIDSGESCLIYNKGGKDA
jgi:hypothetical protein